TLTPSTRSAFQTPRTSQSPSEDVEHDCTMSSRRNSHASSSPPVASGQADRTAALCSNQLLQSAPTRVKACAPTTNEIVAASALLALKACARHICADG